MESIVIFATGSPILADVEESLFRARVEVAAAVQNVPGENYFSRPGCVSAPQNLAGHLKSLPFLVPLFTPGNRQCAVREALALGLRKPFSLIDPTVATPRSLQYAAGLYVNAGVSIGGSCFFDEFVFLNRAASIGHHAKFGRFVSIGPAAVIAGEVTIERGATIGAGAVLLPKIRVGENAVVGAGSVVTRDVPPHSLVFGNPARVIRYNIPGYNAKCVD